MIQKIMDKRERYYNNTNEYLNFISKFPLAPRPMAGCFYTFSYFFHTNPDFKDIPLEKKKFYSFQPMDLILHVNPKNGTFVGINWNQLPVRTRQILLAKIKKQYPTRFDETRIRIPGINYRKLFLMLRRIGVAMRRYRFERVRMLRYIPTDSIDELMKFYANFYYRTNYNWVVSRYNTFKPIIP